MTFIDTKTIDNYDDILGLCRLINSCNKIFTISNTTAHLAAALGKEVYLILPYNHQSNTWYWFSDVKSNQSLWYPNVRLLIAKDDEPISSALNHLT